MEECVHVLDFTCMATEGEPRAGQPQRGTRQRHVPMSPGVNSAHLPLRWLVIVAVIRLLPSALTINTLGYRVPTSCRGGYRRRLWDALF